MREVKAERNRSTYPHQPLLPTLDFHHSGLAKNQNYLWYISLLQLKVDKNLIANKHGSVSIHVFTVLGNISGCGQKLGSDIHKKINPEFVCIFKNYHHQALRDKNIKITFKGKREGQ